MTDAPPDPEPDAPPDPEPEPEPSDDVRDPAKVLADNRRQGRELAAARKELKAAQATIDEMQKASMSELDKRIAEERLAAADEATSRLMPIIRELTFAKHAQGKTSDPSLVGEMLAKEDIDVNDEEAIEAAITGFIEKHPSLAPGPGTQWPAFEQGPRGNGAVPPKTMNDQLMDVLGIQRGGR